MFFSVGLVTMFGLDSASVQEIVALMHLVQLVLMCVCGFAIPKLSIRIFGTTPAALCSLIRIRLGRFFFGLVPPYLRCLFTVRCFAQVVDSV